MARSAKSNAGRLELRFPDWNKKEQPKRAEMDTMLAAAAIILARDARDQAEIHFSTVVCGLYGYGEGALVAYVTNVTEDHTIIEVRNN